MKIFKVLLESRDGQQYEYECRADTPVDAGAEALERLKEIGYSIYGYRVKRISELVKPEE